MLDLLAAVVAPVVADVQRVGEAHAALADEAVAAGLGEQRAVGREPDALRQDDLRDESHRVLRAHVEVLYYLIEIILNQFL